MIFGRVTEPLPNRDPPRVLTTPPHVIGWEPQQNNGAGGKIL